MDDRKAGLPLAAKLLFSTGDLTAAVPLTVLNFYQLYFLTDVARLPPALAGWCILVVKLWDAVNDPLVGVLSDRWNGRWGRRRGPMLMAAFPLAICFAAVWFVPDFSRTALACWYAVWFMLLDTFFTVYHVSFNSLTPALARGYDERSSLNGYRMAFSIAGTLAAIILMVGLERVMPDPRQRFAAAGVVLALFCLVPPFLAFRAADGYDTAGTVPPGDAVRSTVRVLSNRPFRLVMGLYLFSWTTTAVISSALVYFVAYYLRRPEHANLLVLTAELAAIACIPAVVALAKRWDKRRAFILGCLVWIAVQAAIAALTRDMLGPAYLLSALAGVGIATAYVLPWSMIPDVIDQDERESGERREGSFYAFASFFQKLGTALALWLMARLLAASGYVSPTAAVPYPEQPAAAVASLRLVIGLAPALLLVAAVAFAWRYPLGRESGAPAAAGLAGVPEPVPAIED
jgi:GPH family glycoside/pentoside/hexuronide:cation symporter